MGSTGTERARFLLNGVPDRFNDYCHMDQITFVQLADWLMEHAESNIPREISIEECLFVFLDIVAQGNSFKAAAYGWDHDVQLTQSIFIVILNALNLLREKEEISPSCPAMSTTRSRWRVLRGIRPGKSRMDGMVKIGDDNGGGLEISQESLTQALTALNNFIHEHKEI
ncbi:hypothetical protein K458DRAFT_309795 [Lentithecium fluviatile CBS 122367]|uniref:DUF8040 domain-containing protein n=1 Tax=Lentithecium fluviatile CBS 122367 TaxID=1168545 RepID=A0A6G1ITH3_9PLEO|nr:hypothetical protein K458DRAFT_309795 [Lentithecium fluviatile CBS 122367]